MKITLSQIKTAIHYLLIYFMIAMSDSYLQINYFRNLVPILFLVVSLIVLLIYFKIKDQYVEGFISFLLATIIILRYTVGGVGLIRWAVWTGQILIVLLAIRYNSERFIERYVKTVIFLAIVSLLGYAIYQISPELTRRLLIAHYDNGTFYRVWSDSVNYNSYSYYADGLLFFVVRENETRNIGIFREPGVYQIVLNTALFFILFLNSTIRITKKKRTLYFIILIITIMTTQSTTGFLSSIVIMLAFMLTKDREYKTSKFYLLIIAGVIFAVLYLDYLVNGSVSIISSTLLKKIISNNGNLDFSVSTGRARMGTIQICFESIINHPFGIGYDQMNLLLNRNVSGYVAAALLQTAAVFGIIPWFIMISWIFYPVLNEKMPLSIKVAFIFIFINTTLSESSLFYTNLIVIPIYYRTIQIRHKGKKGAIYE